MTRKPLLGYLVSHPIQYQAPLFRRLASSPTLDFVALFGCDFGVQPSFDRQFGRVVDFGIDLLGGYRSRFIPQLRKKPAIDRFFGLISSRRDSAWSLENVDILILHGWRTAMMWQAAAIAASRGFPYLLRAETPVYQNQPAFSLRQHLRNAAVRKLVSGAAGALALGTSNERFYSRLNCPRDRIYRVPYFVDNTTVAAAASWGRANRGILREQLQIPERSFVLIVVAKLIKRKRPLEFIRLLPFLPKSTHVIWVGSGELEQQVRAEAKASGVSDRVHLPGFLPAEQTWQLMGAADLLVLPSEQEPWGLVVNEAVAAGLPTLVSDQCGAAEDLVSVGRTGEIVSTHDQTAWIAAITRWWQRSVNGIANDNGKMLQLAEKHSIEVAAHGIEKSVCAAVAQTGKFQPKKNR